MYTVILADPPWKYNNQKNNDPTMGGITYPVMSDDEIAALDIDKLAAKDSLLFMWATLPKLNNALYVIEQWGFTYTTCPFVWLKLNPLGSAKKIDKDILLERGIYSGLGHWTNGNVELCLMGKRGTPKRIAKNVKQVILAPRSKHSEKPKEIYERIEALVGNVPKIELFARKKIHGWDCMGLDINGRIEDMLMEIVI